MSPTVNCRRSGKKKEEIVRPLVNQSLKVANPTIHQAISQSGYETISPTLVNPSFNQPYQQKKSHADVHFILFPFYFI